jgi:hypothetical protein
MEISMNAFLKWLLIIFLALVGIFFAGGFFIPDAWQVSRSKTIAAPSDAVYAQVATLKNWPVWSPWTAEKDPSLTYTYEGPETGVGAKQLWKSAKMGTGWLEIKEADPAKGVSYELFIDMGNMQSTIKATIAFMPADGGTHVTWTDRGNSEGSLVKRWMSLMISKMLGGELDVALTGLKKASERPAE